MQLYMLCSCLVLLLTVLLNMSVSVRGQGARSKLATINDLVAKATKKIDKAFINKKIEEKKKTPQKVEYRRRTYKEQKLAAEEKRNRGKAKMKRKPIRTATRV